jgi:asparagine N-glycosylation enzyme membrane subunit Stt3
VFERSWRLPWIKDRSPLERGIIGAVGLTLALGFVALETSRSFFRDPSPNLLIGIAGVGATIYIAYIVGMASLLRETKVRGGERANFVGFLTAFGVCGFFGIGIALVLAGRRDRSMLWIEQFGFAWGSISLFFLGGMVSALPLIAYDAIRNEHVNPEE